MTDTRSAVTRDQLKPLMRGILLAVVGSVAMSCDSSSSRQQTNSPVTIAELQPSHAFHFRLGDPVNLELSTVAQGGSVSTYSVYPQLPSGLTLDAVSGRVTGAAATLTEAITYTLDVTADGVSSQSTFLLGVHAPLPEALDYLDDRYSAELVLADAAVPVRMAMAPDGRLFFIELMSGRVRIINPQGQLIEQPFAALEIESEKEKGLLGLALDPEFKSNGYVYVYATVPGHEDDGPHAEIIRFTELQNRTVDKTILVKDLPVADLHNGGELLFDQSGHLFLGRGDTDDVATAQQEGSLSGRVLRYTKDGAIPVDNPYPGSAEWSRGLRNTFAMAIQPETGDLFGADAGPANDDKLNYLEPGKNFVWGMEEEPQGSGIGFTIKVWEEVITPTALFFHSGAGVPLFKNQLFLSSYNDATVRRILLAGDRFTDYLREIEFAVLDREDAAHKPLHIMEGQNGAIYLSTFNAIYRLYPH